MSRSALAVLLLCAALVTVHMAVRWDWMIDDAAIVFAYARNWAAGDGLVALPGGERVEGYSDPTWLALLALGEWVGIPAMRSAGPLALLLSIATLPLVWLTARRALPDHAGPGPLLAPVVLTLNAQFSLWAGSGLENALFCFLLALGIHLTLVDMERQRFPWSSLAWLGLVWTRPEGALYAGFGLVALVAGRGLPSAAGWLAAVVLPSLGLEALRLWYFAWPLPNTAYAKLTEPGAMLVWNGAGWGQLRDWADRLWHGWLVPVYTVGLVGVTGRRARWAAAGLLVVALLLLWPGPDWLRELWLWPRLPAPPRPFVVARMGVIALVGAGLLGLGLGRPGARARVLCGSAVLSGVAFAIAVGGDWMGAYRWTSLFTPPLAVLFAVGVTDLADAAQRAHTGQLRWSTAGWTVVAFGVGLLVPPNLSQSRDHALFNGNPTPWIVRERVEANEAWARRLHVEEPLVRLDVDMGGAMWFAPETGLVDLAALVDVPLAHHEDRWKDTAFVESYVLDERRPHLAFLPPGWIEISGLHELERWQREYVPLPEVCRVCAYMLARRDLIVAPRPRAPVLAELGGVVTVHEVATHGPWGQGRRALLDVPVSVAEGTGASLIASLSDGQRVVSFALPLGYGVLPPATWRDGEVFHGRHTLTVPSDLEPGTWDLGLVALDSEGAVLPAAEPSDEPRYARGELLLHGAVEVVSASELDAEAERLVAAVDARAAEGACADAEATWHRALRLRPDDEPFVDAHEGSVGEALSACYARAAEGLDPEAAAPLLARSHRWDHRSPVLARVGEPVAEALVERGLAAREAGDVDAAWHAFDAVLGFQPWRAWVRRYAEEARAARLERLP